VIAVPEWEWVIGAGIYLDDINTEMLKIQTEFRNSMFDSIKSTFLLIIFFIGVFLFLMLWWNNKTHICFKSFVEYFIQASKEDIHLDTSTMHFNEFKELGKVVNHMIDSRIEAQNEIVKANKALQILSERDSLTNLYNRRFFFTIAKTILEISVREKTQTSVIMIDIDRFKTINDTYGHFIGDEAIKFLSKQLIELTRDNDVLARIGGEEFAIIFPNTDIDGAYTISEKIRNYIKNAPLRINDYCINLTVSIGVSEYNKADNNIENALNRADQALYQAKNSGRNKTSLYTEP
jgi:diguanylate cyclase (GGDEF)-like protein